MATYDFMVTLDRALVDEDYDRLYEAGLDDAAPGVENGVGVLDVSREASSMSAAIVSVALDVARAGLHVVDIQNDDLVTLGRIAERTGRSHESVRLLASGKRGPGGFPARAVDAGQALYSWTLVSAWFTEHFGPESAPAVTTDQRLVTAASLLLRAAVTAGSQLSELAPLVTGTRAA